MKKPKTSLPIPDANARLTPSDFGSVLSALPDQCVLIGGQAVAWWALRYGCEHSDQIHSRDIDLWGDRESVELIAEGLQVAAYWPHKYEMTVLAGALPIRIGDTVSSIEVLHTVPGLDHADPQVVSVEAVADVLPNGFRILTPVSLLLVKLHGLRHFEQEGRNDLSHVRSCIQTSSRFIAEMSENPKATLWNCNRILHASTLKPYVKLASTHGFRLLDAIPVEEIEKMSRDESHPGSKVFRGFLENQWPRFSRDAL